MIQNMQEIHPKWGLIDASSLPPTIPLQLAGKIQFWFYKTFE